MAGYRQVTGTEGLPGGANGMQEIQEMRVQSLGREDTLEKEVATLSSMHAWRIPLTEESGGLHTP